MYGPTEISIKPSPIAQSTCMHILACYLYNLYDCMCAIGVNRLDQFMQELGEFMHAIVPSGIPLMAWPL